MKNPSPAPRTPNPTTLRREVGLGGAVLLGLGSMLGSGVFVALGLAAGLASPGHGVVGVLGAVGLAGLLALCNGLSAAQLAGAYAVSGGTYEYAHRVGWPAAGAAAGTLFLVAKSASAATAALGLAGYVLETVDAPGLVVPGAVAVVVMALVVTLEGVRRSNRVNAVLVSVTLAGLLTLVVALGVTSLGAGAALPPAGPSVAADLPAPGSLDPRRWFEAAALLFVAFTGYGRVATLSEEVRSPRRTIPRAVVVTVVVCLLVYASVAAAAVHAVGGHAFAEFSKTGRGPLQAVAAATGLPGWIGTAVAVSAVAALFGVVLNLLLGLSRVVLAMGRRGHLPARFAALDAAGSSPAAAVVLVAAVVGGLAAWGSVRGAWSLSAVTVLLYYGVTNAAALRVSAGDRFIPQAVSWLGLAGCLGLAAFVQWRFAAVAGAVIGLALVAHAATARARAQRVTD